MDIITLDVAGQLDTEWFNNGMQPNKGLRVVSHYASGNRSVSILEVPGDDSTPVYRRVNNHYEHVAGPTLADWQQAQDEAEFMAQWQEARQDAIDMHAWASGR